MRDYLKLMRPVRTKRQYRDALAFVGRHFDAKSGSFEGQLVELLSFLIDQYEEKHFPIEAPDQVEAIKFRMEQLGWGRHQLAELVGKNRASEIFNRKRPLSIRIIRIIHKKMGVPAESLIGV